MMTFEEQELVSQLVRTALLAENEKEGLAAMRAAKRKMAALGFDRNHLGVFDQSKGVATTVAANVIRRREAERMEESDRIRRAEALAGKERTKADRLKKQIERLRMEIAEREVGIKALKDRADSAEALVQRVGDIYLDSIAESAVRRVAQRRRIDQRSPEKLVID